MGQISTRCADTRQLLLLCITPAPKTELGIGFSAGSASASASQSTAMDADGEIFLECDELDNHSSTIPHPTRCHQA